LLTGAEFFSNSVVAPKCRLRQRRKAASSAAMFRRSLFRPLRSTLVLLFAGALAASAQVSVRVLDSNIHRDIGGSDSNTGSQDELAKIVNYLRPDVWTINELGGNNVAFNATNARADLVSFINSDLTIFGANPQVGSNYYLYLGTQSDGFITNAIVSRYPLLSQQTYSDGGSTDQSGLRGMAMALVDLPGATDLGVFTAHLKAGTSTTESKSTASAVERQEEADTDSNNVHAWISGHLNAAVVLTGDWNETEETGESSNWVNHDIGESLPAGNTYHPITTMKSTGLSDPLPVSIRGDRDTIDSSSPDARFDYLLYSANKLKLTSSQVFDTKQYTASQLAALNTANSTNFIAADSANSSDHLPVFAVFTVVPEPSTFGLLAIVVFAGVAKRRGRG
jgi:endonuclease/exonuclease/phosphatase family metal-dependent hydrolase